MTAPALVQKLWNYCNTLLDDDLSYGDYVEELSAMKMMLHGIGAAEADGLSTSRHDRKETGRFKSFTYDVIKRDKVNLDIFWLKDESPEDSANLPEPGVIATAIVQDLEVLWNNPARSRRI